MTAIPIMQAASRRNALRLALGGAAVVALPSTSPLAALQVSDPDKALRWHGEQLETEHAAYVRAREAVRAAWHRGGVVLSLQWAAGDERGEPMHIRQLSRVRDDRWNLLFARINLIGEHPVHTFGGLAVKARAIEIHASAAGAALLPGRLCDFASEVVIVAGSDRHG